MREGEIGRAFDPRFETGHERLDEALFVAEARQQRQVHSDGLAGLAPLLQGETANDAELPSLCEA